MSKDDPAGQDGNTGFQAQDQGCHSRIHVFLSDDLQGIGDPAGKHAGVQNRHPGIQDRGDLRVFQDQRRNAGKEPAYQKLDAGHFYPVCFGRKMIDDQYMEGKPKGTDQHKKIAFSNGEPVRDAEQIKAGQGQRHSCPDERAAFFLQKEPQYGNDDDVAGGDETGFAHSSILDADLLKVAGDAQGNPAEDPAGDEGFAAALFPGRRCGPPGPAVKKPDDREQHNAADDASDGIEGKGADIFHAYALSHKGDAPYRCG